MVAREMKDPIGGEFGIVADEITYGADLETALRNLYFRLGQDDLPLFVTAVAIQGSTGGNLGEILENLSSVIREPLQDAAQDPRAGVGRAGLRVDPVVAAVGMFLIIQIVAPDFYATSGTRTSPRPRCWSPAPGWDRQLHHVPAGEFQI